MSTCSLSFPRPGLGRPGLPWAGLPVVWPVAATVLAFILWWPLGLAALALWKGGAFAARLQAAVSDRRDDARRWSAEPGGGSGNSAFDEYRAATLRRLEEERLALDAQQREFAEFLQQLKRARDREEFDRFMAAGRGRGADA